MKCSAVGPYRGFFLIGILAGILGVVPWVVYGFHWTAEYPGRIHAHIMAGLFLLSFISGFAMTAFPKMTATAPASVGEIRRHMILLLSQILGVFEGSERIFFVLSLLTLGHLMFFTLRRYRKRPQSLPELFPMVVMGFVSGMAGAVLNLVGVSDIGNRLFYLNFLLSLVLGVGSRLMPTILRLPLREKTPPRIYFWILGVLLIASAVVEQRLDPLLGSLLRLFVVVVIAVRDWRIFAKSPLPTTLNKGLRVSQFSIIAGNALIPIFPLHQMECLHLIFVSGFALVTIMIASRVILAHGGFDLGEEVRNKVLRWTIGLIILAAATRIAAGFMPEVYERHLAYAGLALIAGLFIWAYRFVPKLSA